MARDRRPLSSLIYWQARRSGRLRQDGPRSRMQCGLTCYICLDTVSKGLSAVPLENLWDHSHSIHLLRSHWQYLLSLLVFYRPISIYDAEATHSKGLAGLTSASGRGYKRLSVAKLCRLFGKAPAKPSTVHESRPHLRGQTNRAGVGPFRSISSALLSDVMDHSLILGEKVRLQSIARILLHGAREGIRTIMLTDKAL